MTAVRSTDTISHKAMITGVLRKTCTPRLTPRQLMPLSWTSRHHRHPSGFHAQRFCRTQRFPQLDFPGQYLRPPRAVRRRPGARTPPQRRLLTPWARAMLRRCIEASPLPLPPHLQFILAADPTRRQVRRSTLATTPWMAQDLTHTHRSSHLSSHSLDRSASP